MRLKGVIRGQYYVCEAAKCIVVVAADDDVDDDVDAVVDVVALS